MRSLVSFDEARERLKICLSTQGDLRQRVVSSDLKTRNEELRLGKVLSVRFRSWLKGVGVAVGVEEASG